MSDHRAPQRASLIGRPSRRLLAVLTVLLAVGGTTLLTGASFTSGTDGSVTVGAAKDYYPPRVSVTSPGATVTGPVAVSAPASDTGSGVKQVVVQYAAAGSTSWTTLCTDTTSPYSCTWDTVTVADGDYQLRAIATDNVGTTATSATVTTKVANPAAVTLAPVTDPTKGTVPLAATVTGAGTRTVTSSFLYRVAGTTGSWLTACSGLTGTMPSCSWNTVTANGGPLADTYDIRVQSVVGSGGGSTTVTADQADVTIDNAIPSTVTVDAPSPMSGTVQVTATALDDDSGVASVALAYRPSLGGSWTVLCTVTAEPYRCALNTTSLTNLVSYDLRAVATDVVGNSATATAQRTVNNLTPTVSITSPLTGDRVTGTRTITTDVAPNGGSISKVVLEARPAGSTLWTTVCTVQAAPYSCDWATGAIASGSWELRATMSYVTAGLVAGTATSALVTVTVDNSPLRALDVQASNGGVLGKADGGDTLTLTFAGDVDLTTVKSGWTGAATALTVSMLDKAANPTAATDRASLPGLGTVTFPQNYVRKKKTVSVSASMTATKTTSGGATTTTIVITFGTTASADLSTSSTSGAMTFSPLTSVRSTAGVAASTAAATESGASDRDL